MPTTDVSSVCKFICAACDKGYQTTSTPKEMIEEAQALYGEADPFAREPSVSVCDLCYPEFVEWLKARQGIL